MIIKAINFLKLKVRKIYHNSLLRHKSIDKDESETIAEKIENIKYSIDYIPKGKVSDFVVQQRSDC